MMVLSSLDRASLRSLRAPPLWLCVIYAVAGVLLAIAGLFGDTMADRLLCLAGGALAALGTQKLLLRRPLAAVEKFIRARGPLRARMRRIDWKPDGPLASG